MVTMDTRPIFDDLHDLLFEPFRAALLYREYKSRYSDDCRVMIESITQIFLNDMPGLRNEIQKIIDRNTKKNQPPPFYSSRYKIYAPEFIKEIIQDIGMEAWKYRYEGRLEAEFRVQRSAVLIHQFRHPNNFSQSMHE